MAQAGQDRISLAGCASSPELSLHVGMLCWRADAGPSRPYNFPGPQQTSLVHRVPLSLPGLAGSHPLAGVVPWHPSL